MVTVRDILNRARWRDHGLDALSVHVLHRGAPGDRREIRGRFIAGIRGGGIDVAPESEHVGAAFVPYHRFLAITGADGAELWSKERGMPIAAAPVVEPLEPEPTELAQAHAVVLRRDGDVLVIDGSVGEGGGQMLRTSLTLSLATGTPFVLERIRAGRAKPGLLRQHLTAVNAAAKLSGATVEGAVLGSTRLVFRPGPVRGGDHDLDIGSAGSVGLVLQTIALPLLHADRPSRITIRGGTHALWAPAFPFLAQAWLPLVRRAGAKIGLALDRVGFHPAGGGAVTLTIEPSVLAPLHVGEGGLADELVLRAISAGLPPTVGARELDAARALLVDHRIDAAASLVDAAGKGKAMWLVTRRDDGRGERLHRDRRARHAGREGGPGRREGLPRVAWDRRERGRSPCRSADAADRPRGRGQLHLQRAHASRDDEHRRDRGVHRQAHPHPRSRRRSPPRRALIRARLLLRRASRDDGSCQLRGSGAVPRAWT